MRAENNVIMMMIIMIIIIVKIIIRRRRRRRIAIVMIIIIIIIVSEAKTGYDLGKGGPRINLPLSILDTKLFERTKKQLGTLINPVHIYGEETQMGCGICKCGMKIMQKGKLAY